MQGSHARPVWVVSAITAALLTFSPSAQVVAQEAALLEELIVTARKREQNLQDVAVGVSLLSGRALAEAQLRNAQDLSTLIPTLNVQASSGPSSSSFNIRGIGTQSLDTSVEPSVSTMLDGVVMGVSGMAFLELVDIERVEVLRGPQGTLYGKNASGGVIHIITKDPTAELSGTVAATLIEQDEYRLDGTVSGPLSDTLSYRLTGSMVDDDGFAENVFNGERVNNDETLNLRGKLLWQASEDLELIWSSDYNERECDCTALAVRAILDSPDQQAFIDEQFPVVPSDSNQDVNNDQPAITKIDGQGHSLSVDWNLGSHVATSITALREWQSESIVDLDNRPVNPLALSFPSIPKTNVEQFSQEFRLASAPQDWGSYVIGAFYFNQDQDSGNATTAAVLAPLVPPVTRVTSTEVKNENVALFGELNYAFAPDWILTLGGRYTRDELEFSTVAVGTDNLVFPAEGTVANDTSETDFSPKVALQWDITDSAMTYLSYVSGYKGPAFDTGIIADGNFVAPETSDAWELGLKSTWFDNQLVLNIALFYAEYQDFQAQASVDDDVTDMIPPEFILVNAGEVSTQGIEIEFLSQPTDNWIIRGGFAYTEGTIDEYLNGNCSGPQKFRGECPDGAQDLSGGDLPYTPEWKFTLSTDYRIDFDNFAVTLGADLRSQDDVLYELSQDPYTRQDAYTVVDARVALTDTESRYKLSVFVENVFDEDYASLIYGQSEILLPNAYIHGVPKNARRTAGIALRYDF